jgi:LacI family transcriptional regulator
MPGRPPIFLAVAERLRGQLAAGSWSDGLPAERALAAALKVSRTTLRKALDAMAEVGERPAPRRADWPRVLFLAQRHGHVNDRITASLAGACAQSGMHVDLSCQTHFPPWSDRLRSAVRTAASGCRCIVANVSDITEIDALGLPPGVIRIAFGFHHPSTIVPGWQVVISDRLRAAYESVGRLHALGHRHIGLVCGGDPGDAGQPWGRPWKHDAAWLGWSAGIAAHETRAGTILCLGNDDDLWEAQAMRWLRLRDRPSALVLDMDWRARPFLAACARLGLSVPGDLSLAGSGDTPWAVAATPHLTTWSYEPETIGRIMALLAAGRQDPAGSVIQIAPRLVERGSTGPPRQARARLA